VQGGGEAKRFNSLKEASDVLGVSSCDICKVLAGRRKAAGGYSFSYAPQPDLPGETWRQVPGLPDGCIDEPLPVPIRAPRGAHGWISWLQESRGRREDTPIPQARRAGLLGESTKTDVDHLNTDRSDCHPGNLEWVTRAENIKRSYEKNKKRKSSGPAQSKPVKARRVDGTLVGQFGSTWEAARELSLRQGGIFGSAAKGCQCKGYYFEWVEPEESKDLEGEVWAELTPELLDFVRTKTHGATLIKKEGD
jgi:hypothetical protein